MLGQPKQANSASMAIVYITIGALVDVWTVIWYLFYLVHAAGDNRHFYCTGLFFSGLVLMLIGFAVGRSGRSAREAEVAAAPVQPTMVPVQAAPVQMVQAVPPPAGTVAR